MGLTPWEVRKARAERKLGPVRQQTANRLERAERVASTSIGSMHRANIRWSRNLPFDESDMEGDTFSPGITSGASRRGLAILVNQYHESVGESNPAYVLAFYNAIVNPESNYMSDHTQDGDTITPHLIGNRVVGNKAFRDYLIPFAEVIAEVDMDAMEAWVDERYSMA